MKDPLNCSGHVDDLGYGLMHHWRAEGASLAEIAKRLNIASSTVCRNLRNPSPPSSRARAERQVPQKLRNRRKAVVALALKKRVIEGHRGRYGNANPIVLQRRSFASVSLIGREMRRSGHEMSNSTVRRDLIRSGFKARRKPRGPRRRAGDAGLRLAMARRWLRHRSSLKHHIFSDEKLCDTNDHGVQYEWCRPGQLPAHAERDRFSPRVHVWACIGVGLKLLVFLPDGGIDHTTYIRKCLTPNRHELAANGRIFVQDGARAHACSKTMDYLKRSKIIVAQWPPRSPDLNPIESLWGRLQAQVSDRGPTDTEMLKVFWQEAWDAISQEEIDRTVLSFEARLKECVRVGGQTVQQW